MQLFIKSQLDQQEWRCDQVEVLINCPKCGMRLFAAERGVQHCNKCGYWTKKVWLYA